MAQVSRLEAYFIDFLSERLLWERFHKSVEPSLFTRFKLIEYFDAAFVRELLALSCQLVIDAEVVHSFADVVILKLFFCVFTAIVL